MTTELKAIDVFTPGIVPTYTYVNRAERNLEERLRDALEVPGKVVSVSGPSKSGKTVLIARIVGERNLIQVSGAGVRRAEDVWTQVLDYLGLPQSTSSTSQRTVGGNVELAGTGGIEVPLFAKASAEGKVGGNLAKGTSDQRTYSRGGLGQAIKELTRREDLVVLVDDFHYIPKELQEDVARQIKDAAGKGVNIVTASVPHRADDVVRSNSELRGRLETIDFEPWKRDELLRIADLGFQVLNAEVDSEACLQFARESFGSPQLMQSLCLAAARYKELRVKSPRLVTLTFSADERRAILEGEAAIANFRSLVQVLEQGPKVRGQERKIHQLKGGIEGDVYRCLLYALAADPPTQSLRYREITGRIEALCQGQAPAGSSIVTACENMHRLAADKFPKEVVFDWDDDKQVLTLPDPYLLYYLRWSGILDS